MYICVKLITNWEKTRLDRLSSYGFSPSYPWPFLHANLITEQFDKVTLYLGLRFETTPNLFLLIHLQQG